MKKQIILFLCFCTFLTVSGFFLCGCDGQPSADNSYQQPFNSSSDYYAELNGEIITNSEVDYYKSKLKGKILSQYAEQYDISDFSDFWNKEYDGHKPLTELEEMAFYEAVRSKIILLECKKYNVYSDISFDALKTKAQNYNKEHQDTQSVGLISVDMDNFYEYYVNNGELQLQNIIKTDDFEQYIQTLINSNTPKKKQ